jgi:hypothetical protein
LNRSFRAVSHRLDRRPMLHGSYRAAKISAIIAASAGALYLGLVTLSPWPPIITIRHLLSFRNCEAAREMGLAPANKGDPGYWQKHDRDRDGVSCEPWYHH